MNRDTVQYCLSLVNGMLYHHRFSKCGSRLAILGQIRFHFTYAHVELSDNVKFWPNVKLSVNGTKTEQAKLCIGRNVSIGDRTEIHVGKEVLIGDDSIISWDCCIMDRDYHCFNSNVENIRPVHIGKHVWIGCRCVICKGVTIGDGAVIAAGSIVTHDVAPNSMVGGSNARCLNENIFWR